MAEPNVPALEGVRIPMAGPIPPGQVADPGLGMGGVLCWWAHPTIDAPPVRAIPRPPRASLVVPASGGTLTFPTDQTEILIGREDPINGIFPEIDLTDHGGDEGGSLASMHASCIRMGSLHSKT